MGAGSPIKLSMPEGGPVDMMFGGDDPLSAGAICILYRCANANVLFIETLDLLYEMRSRRSSLRPCPMAMRNPSCTKYEGRRKNIFGRSLRLGCYGASRVAGLPEMSRSDEWNPQTKYE